MFTALFRAAIVTVHSMLNIFTQVIQMHTHTMYTCPRWAQTAWTLTQVCVRMQSRHHLFHLDQYVTTATHRLDLLASVVSSCRSCPTSIPIVSGWCCSPFLHWNTYRRDYTHLNSHTACNWGLSFSIMKTRSGGGRGGGGVIIFIITNFHLKVAPGLFVHSCLQTHTHD